MSNPHLHTVKNCPEKSRPIKNGHHMHSVMLTIVHSYKLDWKKINLWCELGWFLQRQSHILIELQCFPVFMQQLLLVLPMGVALVTKCTVNSSQKISISHFFNSKWYFACCMLQTKWSNSVINMGVLWEAKHFRLNLLQW